MNRMRIVIMFACIAVAVLTVLAFLERVGLSANVITRVQLGLVLAFVIFAGIRSRTLNPKLFHTDGHRMQASLNGLTIALVAFGVLGFTTFPGLVVEVGVGGYLAPVGIMVGVAIIGLLFSSVLNADSVATPTATVISGRSFRLLNMQLALMSIISVSLVFLGSLTMMRDFLMPLVSIEPDVLMMVFLLLIGLPVVLGGQRAASWLQMTMGIFFFIGLTAPVAWLAFSFTGMPIPQIAMMQAASALEFPLVEMREAWNEYPFQLSANFAVSELNWIAYLILAGWALGSASFIPLLARFPTGEDQETSYKSTIWALGILAFFVSLLPAYALLFELQLLDTVTGNPISKLAASGKSASVDFVTLCGRLASDLAAVNAECGAGSALSSNDINVEPSAFFHALEYLSSIGSSEFPPIVFAMIAVGVLAAGIGICSAAWLGLGQLLANDIISSIFRKGISPNRAVFLTRLSVALTGLLAFEVIRLDIASLITSNPVGLIEIGLVLGGASLFPMLFLMRFFPQANPGSGMLAGLVGFAAAIYVIFNQNTPEAALTVPALIVELPSMATSVLVAAGAVLLGTLLGLVLPRRRAGGA